MPSLDIADRNGIWHIDNAAATQRLIDEIFDPSRYRPLLVVSEATDTKRPRLDLDALIAELGDSTYVATLACGAPTWAFTHNVPDRFRAYGGGTRLYWPYAARDDDPDRHPLFITRTEEDSTRSINRIARTLRDKGYLPDDITPPPPPPWAADTTTQDEDKVERLLADLETAHDRIHHLTQENNDLRRNVHGLQDRLALLDQRLHATNVYTDPDRQLRHEIEQAWLVTYAEPEREEHRLADYQFGADFIESVNTIEGVERNKIVATCVDVLTRRAWEVNGRQARQMRTTPSAGSPYLTRTEDGASAWRCNIQTGTASARRLMWWEVPDGTIELAVVALHDDTDMH